MLKKFLIIFMIISIIPMSIAFASNYEYVREYVDEVAVVVNDEYKCGLVNKNMKELIPCIYDEIYNYGFACAVEKDGKWGIVDLNNNEILPCVYEEMAVCDRNENGYIMVRKEGYLGCIYLNNLDAWDFEPYIQCREVIECKYSDLSFTGHNSIIANLNGKNGIIDLYGNEIVPFIYDYISSFSEGKACVMLNDKVGYIDYTGEVVIPIQYDSEEYMYYEFGHEKIVYDYTYASGYYHYEADAVADEAGNRYAHYCYYTPYFANGYAMVKKNGKYGYINTNNEQVIPCIYDELGEMNDYYVVTAGINGKYGAIDMNNNVVVDFKYDYVTYDEEKNNICAEVGESFDWWKNEVKYFEYSFAKNVIPTPSKIFVNNKEVEVEAYNIDGNNYFKLRDIAYLLDTAGKSFEVEWNDIEQSIYMSEYGKYICEGNELKILNPNKENKKAIPSKQSMYYNGYQIELIKYNIDGYNYIKLRDILELHDVEVVYDEETRNVYINTMNVYEKKNRISTEQAQVILNEKFQCEEPFFVWCQEGTTFYEGERYFLVQLGEYNGEVIATSNWYIMSLDGKDLYLNHMLDNRYIFCEVN
ncbi:MAG: hypothetical protein E7311_04170 [Clostridiales bacterium]|nr:hypothetical protein [Clostridiales bacterium]